MHYKNGREAVDGDPVITKIGSTVLSGRIHSLQPGCESCNGQVAFPVLGGVTSWCVTVGECYHAGDALQAITPTGIEVVPAPAEKAPAEALPTSGNAA